MKTELEEVIIVYHELFIITKTDEEVGMRVMGLDAACRAATLACVVKNSKSFFLA